MQTTTLKINNINRKSIFWALTAVLVLLLSSYFCFITQTIINTASYQSMERKITALNSEISGLESQYISLKRDVDYDLAKELGYVEVTAIKFVDKSITSQTLSLVK